MAKKKGPSDKSVRAKAPPELEKTDEGPSDKFARVKVPPELDKADRRVDWGLDKDPEKPGPYIVELNLQHIEGLSGAAAALREVCGAVAPKAPIRRVTKTYFSCYLTVAQVHSLATEDERQAGEASERARIVSKASTAVDPSRFMSIFRIWPDFKVKNQIDASVATVKADAAFRAYSAGGEGIVWAVLDSGVDYRHLHFGNLPAAVSSTGDGASGHSDPTPPAAVNGHTLLDDSVSALHRCFCALKPQEDEYGQATPGYLADPDDEELLNRPTAERQSERAARIEAHRIAALSDQFGHGSHVAGIIAGGLKKESKVLVFLREFKADAKSQTVTKGFATRRVGNPERLRGVAPDCKIVSLRVLDDDGEGRTSDVISALEYIRERVNDDPKLLRIHGVNLSVGYEFDAELFACGQSPVCAEVDRLVQAGVVVVTAAGNTGYGHVQAVQRVAKVGLSNTINDPGNAALGITVGATHRDAPHTYGVSYFSSKGPTGDGRLKPDLVAPGERITSCATGKKLDKVRESGLSVSESTACYVDDSGTSMAAPHVSGAVAAFLSIRREFIGKPLDVKRIFLESATPLGRERYFEGHGLLDLMRAIQSI